MHLARLPLLLFGCTGAVSRILLVSVSSLLACISYGACPEPTWIEGYQCKVNGTCTCKNNADFLDAYGYLCTDWEGNCIGAADIYGYTSFEEADLVANCPKACAVCYCAEWTGCFSKESQIMKDTKHFRNLRDRTSCPEVDEGCLEPTWRNGYKCEVEGTCNCTDNAAFVDKSGYGCSSRWDRQCLGNQDSLAEEVAVISNCPKTCGVCSCGTCSSTIQAGPGGWFSADLTNNLFKLFLEEILGYTVQHTSQGNSDYSLEVWPADFWFHYAGTDLHGADPETFDLGYHGTEGIYYAGIRYESCYRHDPDCTDKCSLSDVVAGRCANRSDAFELFVSHLTPKASKHFPEAGYYDTLWDDIEEQVFIPEHCTSGGSNTCMELLSHTEDWYEDTALQYLISTTFFPYRVRKVGVQRTREAVEYRISLGEGVVFTYWEPDPFMVRTQAVKIAFPFELSHGSNAELGYGHAIGCKSPVSEIKNVVRSSLQRIGPEVYYALRNFFRVSEMDMTYMMATHVLGGGRLDDLKEVSCRWMTWNQNQVYSWLPPCAPGTIPYILANKSLGCCNGTLFRYPLGTTGCKPICKLAHQVPDAITGNCWPRCSSGTVLDRTTSRCMPCPVGTIWTKVSDRFFIGVVAECQCSAGHFETTAQAEIVAGGSKNAALISNCQRCPPGKYQYAPGRTSCIACSKGFFADVVGLTECLHCPVGKYVGSVGSTGCYQCPQKRTSEVMGSTTLEDCKCKAGYYFDSSMGWCNSCGLLKTTADMGAESSDECNMTADVKTAIGCGAGGLVGLFLLMTMLHLHYRAGHKKQIKELKTTQTEHYNRIIGKAYTCMKFLEHPMVLLRADDFLELGCLVNHEILRDQGKLIFLDSLDRVTEFKETHFIIFLSHQWLGWGKPDPENFQYETMCSAIKNVFQLHQARKDMQLEHWYVWCDVTSVPQAIRNMQLLAIRSLPIYACVADVFVIIAPTCKHSGSGNICNLHTYLSRGWCRAEILSKLCGTGMQDLYIVHGSCAQIEAVTCTEDFLGTLDVRVFHGDFSCCYLGHKGSERCDKEDLVPTVLGLYALVLSQKERQDMSHVLQHINQCKMDCFPRRFTFAKTDGGEEERELFGPLITLLEEHIAKHDNNRSSGNLRRSMTALLKSTGTSFEREPSARFPSAGVMCDTKSSERPRLKITPDPPGHMVLDAPLNDLDMECTSDNWSAASSSVGDVHRTSLSSIHKPQQEYKVKVQMLGPDAGFSACVPTEQSTKVCCARHVALPSTTNSKNANKNGTCLRSTAHSADMVDIPHRLCEKDQVLPFVPASLPLNQSMKHSCNQEKQHASAASPKGVLPSPPAALHLNQSMKHSGNQEKNDASFSSPDNGRKPPYTVEQ